MRVLFLFLDGVGLGADDPARNPFAAASLPTLEQFTKGQRWLKGVGRLETERGTFAPVDANLGIEKLPQSATGQATIMTGLNVPQRIGKHYGPKPTPDIMSIIEEYSLVKRLTAAGLDCALLNTYPSGFFDRFERGKLLLSSNQYAIHVADVPLRDGMAFYEGRALSVDYTGEMWFERVAASDAAYTLWRERTGGMPEDITLTPREAGHRLAELATQHDFTFFDQWLTDYIGHRGTLADAVGLLEVFDEVMAGLLERWDETTSLIVVTSDHGNIEDIDERGHTRNAVPALVIGKGHQQFADGLKDLTGFTPAVLQAFGL